MPLAAGRPVSADRLLELHFLIQIQLYLRLAMAFLIIVEPQHPAPGYLATSATLICLKDHRHPLSISALYDLLPNLS